MVVVRGWLAGCNAADEKQETTGSRIAKEHRIDMPPTAAWIPMGVTWPTVIRT